MYTLKRSFTREGSIGRTLPDPFQQFKQQEIQFRYGSASLIAGTPGSYKSTLALNLLVYWVKNGLFVQYFSADSDEYTVKKRISGILTGDPVSVVDRAFTGRKVDRYLNAVNHISDKAMFVYRQLDIDGITNHSASFDALFGGYPDVVFIDNLMNYSDNAGDYHTFIEMINQLDSFARESGAHVCILHHASEGWSKDHPGMPPPSWAIQGKVTQIPVLSLTVAAAGNILRYACVKNRHGPQDAAANNVRMLNVNQSMRITESTIEGAINV